MNYFAKVSYDQFREAYGAACYDIYEAIQLPARSTKLSAGYDFKSPIDFTLAPGETIKIPTGIKVFLDPNKFLAIYPRSGHGFKYKLQLYNTCGIIDADYSSSDNEGHIMVKLYNDSPDGKTLKIHAGDGICQGVIQAYFITDDDEATGMRNGGFGSTDKR